MDDLAEHGLAPPFGFIQDRSEAKWSRILAPAARAALGFYFYWARFGSWCFWGLVATFDQSSFASIAYFWIKWPELLPWFLQKCSSWLFMHLAVRSAWLPGSVGSSISASQKLTLTTCLFSAFKGPCRRLPSTFCPSNDSPSFVRRLPAPARDWNRVQSVSLPLELVFMGAGFSYDWRRVGWWYLAAAVLESMKVGFLSRCVKRW